MEKAISQRKRLAMGESISRAKGGRVTPPPATGKKGTAPAMPGSPFKKGGKAKGGSK